MAAFNVTYEIVTPESAEHGDAEERGFILQDATLRDAFEAVQATRTSRVDGIDSIEPDCYPRRNVRWITIINGMEYETGANESRALHIPDHATESTRRRICRLFGIDSK